jgi:DNA-binding beta-propeller fold protein YncE
MRHWSRGIGLIATGLLVLAATIEIAQLAHRRTPGAYAQETRGTAALKQVGTIDLPGPPGRRFDYLAIDYDDDYLFANHLGAAVLYVIDLKMHAVASTIADVPGGEGVEYAPELKKVYTSNAWDNTIGVIDLRQMKVVKKLPTEAKPDGSAYAPPFHKLYVSDERASAEAIVDVREDRIIKTIHFDSETGMPQYDPVARKVYVNLQDDDAFVVIDPETDTLSGRYAVEGCRRNHGMSLDPEHRLAFLACQGNNVLAVFDLETHRTVAHLPLPKGADVVQFDPGLARVYIACSSGAISVIQEDDARHFHKVEDFPVQRRVHSLVVDRRTHRLYAPEEQEEGQPVARMVIFDALSPSGTGGR